MPWAIIASGQSLTHEQVELVREAKNQGKIKGFIAVSNVGIDMAKDAYALVSHDSNWWRSNPKAYEFNGKKVSSNYDARTERFKPFIDGGCNSGIMAMDYAFKECGAKKLILLGFDMHGTHYFGQHEKTKNSTESDFKRHLNQFIFWKSCPVINCTPNSALKIFPFMSLKDALSLDHGN